MLLDVLLFIFIITGFINGYRRGLIYSIFTFISLFLGIMVAMKFSYVISGYLYQQAIMQSRILPFISFLIILVAVLIVMKIFFKLVQSAAESLFLGGINKIIGGILWASILILIYSTVLWYLDKLHFISIDVKDASKSYSYISALAPWLMGEFSKLVPYFQGTVESIEKIFEQRISEPSSGHIQV